MGWSKVFRSEAGMSTAMGAELFFILSEPFLILDGMSTVSAILAPDDHALAERALADNTEFVALAVAL